MSGAEVTLMLTSLGTVIAFAVVYWRRFLRPSEGRPMTAAARERALRDHAIRQQMEVAQEQLRLNVEVDRCLRELQLEIEQDRARRRLERGQ